MSDLTNDSSNKKKGLGRGLGSLLGGAPVMTSSAGPAIATTPVQTPAVPPEARVWQISIDKLRPSPYQPRGVFEKPKLEELAQSIRTSGIFQPIVARRLSNGAFEIIAGERRWRAAQMAGLHEVPVILKNLGDRETLEVALIENIQREDLNPLEEAEAFQRLSKEFNLTQQQVAEKVGKDRATVANAIRLLQLPTEIQDMVSRDELSVGHAKVLLALPVAADQIKWAKKVRDEQLTVRKLEKFVQGTLIPTPVKTETLGKESNVTQRLISGLSEEVQKLFGTKVTIDYSDSKGKISVHFYSDEELSQIIEKMREGCQKSSISSHNKSARNT